MKGFLNATTLAAGASAAILARDQCCFSLSASGGVSGTVGQLSDGQNRIGGGLSPAKYCINDGGITDSEGRGCILTPPTTQFQCDVGATPTTGFVISTAFGELSYNGNGTFFACPASSGVYNIYTSPVPNQSGCVGIELATGGQCAGIFKSSSSSSAAPSTSTAPASSASSCSPSTVTVTSWSTVTAECETTSVAAPPPPATTVITTTTYETSTWATTWTSSAAPPPPPPESPPPGPPPTQSTGTSCPTTLVGAYQTPHLIVPISSEQPDQAHGTQYNATITTTECTIFNFDVPSSYGGQSCSVIFLFPEQSQLQTSSFDFNGKGDLVFTSLDSSANQQTTWNNAPAKGLVLSTIAPQPGNSYSISTSSCAAGTTQSIEVCGTNGLSLSFFEDYNPSAIGVYITSC